MKKAEEFTEEVNTNETYQAVFEELRSMPPEKEEDAQSARWVWFKRKLCDLGIYDQLTIALMSGIAPLATDKLKKRMSGTTAVDANDEFDMVSMKNKKCSIDNLVFMDALNRTVNRYTGVGNEGKQIAFTQHLHMKYTQLAGGQRTKNTVQKNTRGISSGISERKMRAIMKLTRKVSDIQKKNETDVIPTTPTESFDKAIEICRNEAGCTFTEEDIQYAKYYVQFGKSCDLYFKNSEGEEEILPIGSDADEMFDNMVNGAEGKEIFSDFAQKWENIKAVTKLEERDMIKIFFSRDILIALKLEKMPDKLYRDYEDDSGKSCKEEKWKACEKDIEPKCGSWCPKRKDCKYKKLNPNYRGCYIRIGRIPGETENGDDETYQMLSSGNGEVYDCVLKNEYVQYAFEITPENLYDVYANKLKDFRAENDKFEFTDAIIEKSLGLRAKSLSRKRERYETVIKPRLWELLSYPL